MGCLELRLAAISDILDQIRTYAPDADLQPVMKAYLLAARAHAGQTRKTGEPYLTHPLAVGMILANMRMDVETIATALLHDALEDNPITKEEMAQEMGPVVVDLVDGVTKIGKLKFRSTAELQAENFRKMMLAMSKDLRVILVKLADRLHNMQTLEGHGKPDKQRQISEETIEIFVPIANRLGLVKIKSELEDLCFKYMEPEIYKEIDDYLLESEADRDEYTARVRDILKEQLEKQGVPCDVSGRAKHRFGIYKKMKDHGLKPWEIPDMLAFRVLVDDVGNCYQVLGLVHSFFPPVPDRIKDYIARPKQNGYQSLHTTVLGPEQRRIEIQIRTQKMHRVAEEGIAAHWRYKEGRLALSPDDVAKISRIRDVFDSVTDTETATEFAEAVKSEFYADEVFVFTPAGEVKAVARGATALDFAYSIHTDVGHHCTGAKVNGRIQPLRYILRSGDTVEIMTSPNQRPNRDWLEIAKTGRAIQKIRKYIREEEKELGVRLGREMVESELKRFHWTWPKVKLEGRLKATLEARGSETEEQLFVEVARGHHSLSSVVRDLLPDGVYQRREANVGGLTGILNRFRARSESPVLISGEDGLLVQFARCCQPLPGEPVVGYITRGRGITVHKADCVQLGTLDPDRRIAVEWDPRNSGRHSGEVQIVCTDRPGMLSSITKLCEQAQVNINRAEAKTATDGRALCTLELAVRDVGEFDRLVKNIERLPGVESVARMGG
jgi:guanosine-3',5'-bis(diphosphate) 3'-pyrophosphohydrolase